MSFDDVTITNETDDVTAISIAGPKSRDLLQELTDTDVSNKSFKFMHNKRMEIAGVPVLALRIAYTGENFPICKIFFGYKENVIV